MRIDMLLRDVSSKKELQQWPISQAITLPEAKLPRSRAHFQKWLV